MPRSPETDRTLLAVSVYDALKERIMDQVFPPGDRLNIEALAVDLNVSPTPIREALTRLAAENLVAFEPYKGYRVRSLLTPSDLADLMHVRRLIELDAVRLASQRVRNSDLHSLQQVIDESRVFDEGGWSEGYKQFNHLDERFHLTILSIANNRFLTNAFQSLRVHVELGRFYGHFGMINHRQTCNEHEMVLAELASRNPEAAADALERHLSATERRILNLIDSGIHPTAEPAATRGLNGV
jgi:DNA-binding GntR family transcriptional regulator